MNHDDPARHDSARHDPARHDPARYDDDWARYDDDWARYDADLPQDVVWSLLLNDPATVVSPLASRPRWRGVPCDEDHGRPRLGALGAVVAGAQRPDPAGGGL